MQNWFAKLVELPWLRLMADLGDDVLQSWRTKSLFNSADFDDLKEEFIDDEQILAMLLGMKFRAEDEKLTRRIERSEENKRQIVDETISKLLGQEASAYQSSLSFSDNLSFDINEIIFIVKRIATALKMPNVNIGIPPEIAKKLDRLGVIRRLVHKGNMQMRLVELTGDWFNLDCGVMLCYYGEKKKLAALIPTSPRSYMMNKTSALLQQVFTGLAKFRTAGAEEHAFRLWGEHFADEWRWNYKLRWNNNYLGIVSVVQFSLYTLPVYFVTMNYVNEVDPETGAIVKEGISYASFLAFQAAAASFNATIGGFIGSVSNLMFAKPLVENLKIFFDEVPEISDDKPDADNLRGAIEVRNLCFSYGEDLPEVVKDVNFRIAAGEHVAIVLQNGQLMSGSIFTNISGGQRQRILIARALAGRPSIVIFDEATSALDNRTQAIVTRSLDKMHATQIIVAHRLSTIRNVDRVIVIDKGRIVENGGFDELVAKGFFRGNL